MSGPKRTNPTGRKGHLHTGDLFALGSKSSSPKSTALRHSERDDSKSASSATAIGPGPAKKFKGQSDSSGGGLFSDPIRVGQTAPSAKTGPIAKSTLRSSSPALTSSTTPAIEVRSGELLPAFKEAQSSGNVSKANKLLCGAVNKLKQSRSLKPDSVLNSSLATIAKEYPESMTLPAVIEGLVAVLKRESAVIFKAKSNPAAYVLAVRLLLVGLKESTDWPESVAEVFVEDSLGDRVWVDLDSCKNFVDNICTLFQTRTYSPGPAAKTAESAKHGVSEGVKSEEATEESVGGGETEDTETGFSIEVKPRFSSASVRSLRAHVSQVVSDQLTRHNLPADSVSRNLLRFFMTAVGFSELRLLVAQKIEQWIQNPKLVKQCQELLMTVAVNCHQHSPEDLTIIEALINIRLKTKLFTNQFVACIKELISSHSGNLGTVMKGVVNNELGPYRTPSNMALISMMIHSWPEEAAKLLGGVFQDFLTRKEDYLRALRGFLREIVRVVRNEFNFTAFARALMQERSENDFTQLEQTHKERMAISITDLISCTCMLTANMLIREAYNGYSKGERAMVSQLQEFFTGLGVIQRDGTWWLHTVVPNMYRPQPVDYKACLKKLLFLEPVEAYCNKDNWPPEADRSMIYHLMTEALLKEDTLMRVLVIGLTRELPLAPADAMDIADKLVARAANAHVEEIPRLPAIERKELFSAIFDISAYRPPANIQFPDGYQPPTLAISKLYWKGWILLLVLAAFNPATVGATAWNDYPMLKSMMEMVMTNTFTFPTSTSLATNEGGVAESREGVVAREAQMVKREKESILEYENHLAASSPNSSTITEANSYLLNQVTQLNPKGPARRIPSSVIELIKTVNRTLRLDHYLCLSRSPDFLLDVIKVQGTAESMKWLTDLVEASQSSMEVLPIPCLCEFLMAGYQDNSESLTQHRAHYKTKKATQDKAESRHSKLIARLRNVLEESPSGECAAVLEYFLEKLTQSHITPRLLALKALKDILSKSPPPSKSGSQSESLDENDPADTVKELDWLTDSLPNLPHFSEMLPKLYPLILRACLVETNLGSLKGYINFLTQYHPENKLYQSTVEMSRVMVDRSSTVLKLFNKSSDNESKVTFGLLLSMLKNALNESIHSQSVTDGSESSEVVLLSLPASNNKTIVHLALVEALYLFTACSLAQGTDDYKFLTNLLFPSKAKHHPEAFNVDTKSPVSLPPSAVISHMLASANSIVSEFATASASTVQLCSFIQQFGSEVANIQRVLERLDSLCETREGTKTMRRCITNPLKVLNCIEVHFLRGIETGKAFHTFVQGLSGLASSQPETDLDQLIRDVNSKKSPASTTQEREESLLTLDRKRVELGEIPQDVMEQHLLKLFTPSLSKISSLPEEVKAQFETGLRSIILAARRKSDSKNSLESKISTLVTGLHELLTSGNAKRQFLEGMIKNRFSLTLLRFLTKIYCLLNSKEDQFRNILKQILTMIETKRVTSITGLSVFHNVVTSCADQLGIQLDSIANSQHTQLASLINKSCREIKSSENPLSNEVTILKLASDAMQSGQFCLMEDLISSLAKRCILLQQETECIDFLSKLKSVTSGRQVPLALQCVPSAGAAMEGDLGAQMVVIGDLSGLFVDWLEVLDPQIVRLSPKVSLEMTFGSNSTKQSAESSLISPSQLLAGQGYLLARLTHNSSWPILVKTLDYLLDKSTSKEWICSSVVLDFLWACLHKPSLWKERVKKEAVVNSNFSLGIDEDCCLKLTHSQLECLLDYILSEAAAYTPSTQSSAVALSSEAKEVLYSRLPLLMTTCHNSQDTLVKIVNYLQDNPKFPVLCRELLVQLYHADPRVIFTTTQPSLLSAAALNRSLPSKLDTHLHYLLSTVATASPPESDGETKMTSAALICRRIAIHHPAIMLRQLPVLGWLLRGRAHLTVGEFRNQNHKEVFYNMFSLLELLQPLVFSNSQAEALNSCLEVFFEFLKNQCLDKKKHQSFVTSFAAFLVSYSQHNKDKAAALLFENLETLRSLSDVYTNKKSNLKALVESFPLPSEGAAVNPHKTPIVMIPPEETGPSLSHEQVMPFLKKLESGQQKEDIFKVLHDLEETSHHSADILNHFVPELCRIIQDPELSSCKTAHQLLLRHLKRTPSCVGELLPSFINCLKSCDPRVVMEAVRCIKDLVLVSNNDQSKLLLSQLYNLCVQPSQAHTPELVSTLEACISHTFK